MAVSLNLVARVAGLVRVQELPRQIVDQLADLPLLPGVLTLVEVDGVFGLVEQFADGAGMSVDGLGLGLCGRHAGASSPTGTRSRTATMNRNVIAAPSGDVAGSGRRTTSPFPAADSIIRRMLELPSTLS